MVPKVVARASYYRKALTDTKGKPKQNRLTTQKTMSKNTLHPKTNYEHEGKNP